MLNSLQLNQFSLQWRIQDGAFGANASPTYLVEVLAMLLHKIATKPYVSFVRPLSTHENMQILQQIYLKSKRMKVKQTVKLATAPSSILSASKIIIVLLLFKTFRAF